VGLRLRCPSALAGWRCFVVVVVGLVGVAHRTL
jgi:hypothetical protein